MEHIHISSRGSDQKLCFTYNHTGVDIWFTGEQCETVTHRQVLSLLAVFSCVAATLSLHQSSSVVQPSAVIKVQLNQGLPGSPRWDLTKDIM